MTNIWRLNLKLINKISCQPKGLYINLMNWSKHISSERIKLVWVHYFRWKTKEETSNSVNIRGMLYNIIWVSLGRRRYEMLAYSCTVVQWPLRGLTVYRTLKWVWIGVIFQRLEVNCTSLLVKSVFRLLWSVLSLINCTRWIYAVSITSILSLSS